MLSLKSSSCLLLRCKLTRTLFLPASSLCKEQSRNVQLGVLRSTKEGAVPPQPENLQDSQNFEAVHHDRRVDITNGHCGAPPFTHQLVLGRLATYIGNEGYTMCFNANVQYGDDMLRSHDIAVWQEDASTISENMVLHSDTRVNGVKVPPYVVIEAIAPQSGRKDETDIKHLCAANGVEYLWLVYPDEGRIEVHAEQQGKMVIVPGRYDMKDHLIWPGCTHAIKPFSHLDLNLKEIFEHLNCDLYR